MAQRTTTTTRNLSYELGVKHGALASIGLTIGASVLTVIATGAGAAIWKYLKKQRQLWDAEALMAHRRSVFPQDYDPNRTVPEDILNKLLESANWAPTHGRTEPWRFIVFGGDGRRKLGEKDAEIYKNITPEASFNAKKYAKKSASKLQASYVIAICLKRQDSKKIPEIEEVEAVACAVQNMHLRATSLGVGAYWSSGPGVYTSEMKEFLELGPDDKCLGLFYVGYPKPGFKHPVGSRKPVQDKVRFVYE
ncbi:hypothetical protein H310_06686 [Aphanomyces invadans]|uniref:Nitroreductase domain-containing protein n=1 Tax=Aphanomyces invadans TaxID=157072 RepID=A0A024U586_9STRA|nr:hypothetical protein H310_06686 [Aphanomyces invadans]ETW01057.1 hypothetical protein H310_06686 [Aphanomyces invadans]|eukprot:XP_008870055.1 hypothetical protein H310_06686 [Aphanomyces invadans]